MRHLMILSRAPFTLMMAGTLLGAFFATWCVGGDPATRGLFEAGVFATDAFFAGQWWRLISSKLVHSDWDHVLSNCAGLLLVGFALEPRLGTRRSIVTYLLGALGAAAATLAFCSRAGGASGAIYALVGAYLASPLTRRQNGARAVRLGWPFAVWWVFDGLASGSESYEVCREAHVAGLIVGLCCGAYFGEPNEPDAGRSTRPLRLAAAMLVSLSLLAALVPDPRWALGWSRNAAKRAEQAGDFDSAARRWAVIEAVGDPRLPVDAVFIENAARFRLRRHDVIGARELLSSVAPTLNDAKVYRDIGFLLSQNEPQDERGAFNNWRQATRLNPNMPDVLDAMAMAIVSSEDSTMGRPEVARSLACRAVTLDRRRTPEFLRTLAWAHYRCGDVNKSVFWMRRALKLNPSERTVFASELAAFEEEQAQQRSHSRRKV